VNLQSWVGSAPKAERGLEFYKTPAEATRALIAIEGDRLPHRIWEPACGDGAMAVVLEDSGKLVTSTDIVDRGFGQGGVDFLTVPTHRHTLSDAVVTNPPFSLAQQFVDKAFSLPNISYCALLLRLAFLEGGKRKAWFQANPPARVHISSRRLPMMHREGYEGKKTNSSAIPHAWFVWLRGYDGPPQLRWFDWRDY
jgi:predicted RNA methylase